MVNFADNSFRFTINSVEHVCRKVKNSLIHSNFHVLFMQSNPYVFPGLRWKKLALPPRAPDLRTYKHYCCCDFLHLVGFSIVESYNIDVDYDFNYENNEKIQMNQ